MTSRPRPAAETDPAGAGPADPSRPAALYVTPREKLRLAVVLTSFREERWVGETLRRLRVEGIAEVVAAVQVPAGGPSRSPGGSLLYRLYRGVDRRLHGGTPPGLERADLRDAIPGAELLTSPAPGGGAPAELPAAVAERLAALDLDVILDLAPGDRAAMLHGAARHGVWACRFGARENADRDDALFEDLSRAGPPHALVVSVWSRSAEGDRLRERSFALRPESMWLGQHLEAASAKAGHVVARALRRLALGDPGRPPGADPAIPPPPKKRRGMIAFAARSAVGVGRKKWSRSVREEQWLLAYRTDPARFVARAGSSNREGFRRIAPPPHHFHADPNLFTRDGVDHLFFEDWDARAGRASIGVLAFDAGGRPGAPVTALALDHHLSYPFVFEWEGEVFLLPETSEIGSLRLFRARRFPDRWEHFRDLMTGHEMADATLHLHDGRWYLFASVKEAGGSLKDDLFLFHAATPFGPFRPHPENPIRTDIRCARPAGRLFRRGETLLRPAQDCSTSYGAAIQLCEVQVLSETRYAERIVDRLEPPSDPDLEGCHTLTFSDRIEVIDVKRSIARRPREG